MYDHFQRLELSFFDGQQTGQLMSRATVDLQAVRFFLGYGLVFIVQSALTIVLAAVAMFLVEPSLAAISLAAGALRGSRGVPLRAPVAPCGPGGPAAHRRADRRGRGERLRGARRQGIRGRGATAANVSRTASNRLFDAVDGLDADPGLLQPVHRLPAADRARDRALRRRPPGDRRPDHRRPVQRLLHVPADADQSDADPRDGPRDVATGDGIRRTPLPDPRPRPARHRPRRSASRFPPATDASSSPARAFATRAPPARRCAT